MILGKKIQYLDIPLLAAGWLQIVNVRGGGSGLPVTVLVRKTPNQYICCFRLILCYNLLPLASQKMFTVELYVGYEEDILSGSTSQKYLFG